MFLNRNMKNLKVFLSKNLYFLVVKFSVYLYRLVFVMSGRGTLIHSAGQGLIFLGGL